MRRVVWVGGPVCGQVLSAPDNITHITYDEEYDTIAYRWLIPINEDGHMLWYERTLIATFEDINAERPPQ